MNFFQQLFELIDGIDITVTAKRKNGKITLSVLPQTAGTISPALITGTPEELDAGFFEAVKVPMDIAKGLKADLANFQTSVDKAKEVPANKTEAAKPAPSKKKPVPVKKKDPVKEETKEPAVLDMFAPK